VHYLAILTLLIQIGFAVHVVRTGREVQWIYLIMFIPVVGWVVYLLTQVIPDAKGDPRARSAGRKIKQTLDPTGEVRRLRDQLTLADSLDNRLALAEACMNAKQWDQARELYLNCLTGPYRDDPHTLLKLARCEYELGQAQTAKETLERLIAKNPDFQSNAGHLLYAITLAEAGDTGAALKEYAVLAERYPGEEARVRYALLLQKLGQIDQASEQFEQTLARVKRAPAYYKSKEKQWIRIAKRRGIG